MNRSFLLGIIVASSTWCFSLYLYWLLVQNKDVPSSEFNKIPPLYLADGGNFDRTLVKSQKKNMNQVYNKDDKDLFGAQKSYIHGKYLKEKKFRKISQRLIDEIKPIEVEPEKGK